MRLPMKRCPQCNRSEVDDTLTFCRVDGTPLMRVSGAASEEAAIRVRGGTVPPIEAMIGVAYAKLGERSKAEAILQKVKGAKNDETPPGLAIIYERDLALLYDALGMRDEAFAQLEQAYVKRNPTLPLATTDPAFDNLRSDPRFHDLVRRMGLPQ